MDLRKGKYANPSPFHWAYRGKFVLLGLIFISLVLVLNQIDLSTVFPIKTVRVYGLQHVERQDVERLLTPLVHRGFFNSNIDYIRDRLLQMPWISEVSVSRHWPDRIDVTVIEKEAIARFNQESLLSAAGELFSPKQETYPALLPKLVGPQGQQILMLQHLKDINRLLSPLHAKIYSLELTPYLTWKLILDNGIVLQIGHKDILTRLSHFVKVYPKIVGDRVGDVDYIDLRYSNGIAVRWKAPLNT